MSSHVINTKYDIGEYVYHITDRDSKKGVIIDFIWEYKPDRIKYNVSFSSHPDDLVWMYEEEMSSEKHIDFS